MLILATLLITATVYILTQSSFEQFSIRGSRDDSQGPEGNILRKCSKQVNIVYIKMIKCASTTLSGMFRRFGYTHNLSFVLPPKNRIYLGWPYLLDDTLYRPKKTKQFNILCDHAVYDRPIMDRLMPAKSFYVTSLREPFSQVKSMLNYYNVFNISGLKSSNPFADYLNDIERYEAVYKSPGAAKTRDCIPDGFSMSKNLMSFNLGFPTGFLPGSSDKSEDDQFIQDWIGKLDSELDFVMITEHFHESLVLLRRKLCWTIKDMLFSHSNTLSYAHRANHDETLVTKYRKWSRVDYALYDHFNKSLWVEIAKEGEDFWGEVEHLRTTNQEVNQFCTSEEPASGKVLAVPPSHWNEWFSVDKEFCQHLWDYKDLYNTIQLDYEQMSPHLSEAPPSKDTC